MNACTSTNDRPTAPAPPGARATRQAAEDPLERTRAEDFDRLLRQKAAAVAPPGLAFEPPTPESTPVDEALAAPALPAFAWPAPLRPQPAVVRPDGGLRCAGTAVAGAAVATAQARLDANLAPGADAPAALAAAWEVCIDSPSGAPLEVHATRVAAAGGSSAATSWALNVQAQGPDAALLAQHLPRLNERLRSRGATHSHARIEERGGAPK